MYFVFEMTTYLCYSPTCTPAQLSLLSEAITKYSAFLEREKRKNKARLPTRKKKYFGRMKWVEKMQNLNITAMVV